jgi:hypothetical protein
MKTEKKEYDMKGKALFIKALQGMKPHHAAAKWNFVDFTTPTHSAVLMDFTTPPSYGTTSVAVGAIVKDGEILYAGPATIKHLAVKTDQETSWPEPRHILCEWTGKSSSGKDFSATLEGELPERCDKVDVLSHVPGLIKSIVGGVAGTKPYIFQVRHTQPSSCLN